MNADQIRAQYEREQAKRAERPRPGRAFSGDNRLARMFAFAGEQERKAKVKKSRRKMKKASQRGNR